MILINLLPIELRKSDQPKLDIPYRKIAVVVFVIFLVFAVYNLFIFIRIRSEHRNLKSQWSKMSSEYDKAVGLEKELGDTISQEIEFYDVFVDPPLDVARLLNFTSDLIPAHVWLTQLKIERQKREMSFMLSGIGEVGGAGSRLVEIQNFANQLKDSMELNLAGLSDESKEEKRKVRASITTTSQKGSDDKGEQVQFTATLKTKDFGAK